MYGLCLVMLGPCRMQGRGIFRSQGEGGLFDRRGQFPGQVFFDSACGRQWWYVMSLLRGIGSVGILEERVAGRSGAAVK